MELLTVSARGPPPDWLSLLAGFRPAHNDRADRPILRWQGCRGQVKVKCSADILLAHRALPDAIHPLYRRRPCAPPAAPELFCLSVELADEIRCACLCATPVVLRQSLTVAPRNLNAYVWSVAGRLRHNLQTDPQSGLLCRRGELHDDICKNSQDLGGRSQVVQLCFLIVVAFYRAHIQTCLFRPCHFG